MSDEEPRWRLVSLDDLYPEPTWRDRLAAVRWRISSRVAAWRYRRRLARMSPAERYLHFAILDGIRAEQDAQILYGDGSGELTGLFNTDGITEERHDDD